jgi:hypothetical protein
VVREKAGDFLKLCFSPAFSMAQINDFVSESDGLRLIRAFMRIDVALRRRIVMLVQEIAGDDD